VDAARLAAREGVRIYTIGVGADELLVRGLFGTRKINPSAGLDEEALTDIAEMTGGRYFRARDTKELNEIYGILNELEPVERDVKRFRPRKSLYYWPLSISLVTAALLVLIPGIGGRFR